jgi:hypothetical protein
MGAYGFAHRSQLLSEPHIRFLASHGSKGSSGANLWFFIEVEEVEGVDCVDEAHRLAQFCLNPNCAVVGGAFRVDQPKSLEFINSLPLP